jgi:hypothetical protein
MQLVQDVAVNIQQIATVGALADEMIVPDFCKKRLWHDPSWSPA